MELHKILVIMPRYKMERHGYREDVVKVNGNVFSFKDNNIVYIIRLIWLKLS